MLENNTIVSNKGTRVRYIDIARGIAIICIILGHMEIWAINRVVFTFHVPLFFFITGYFTSDRRGLKEFCLNKFRTLIVPYIATCIVMILCAAALEVHRGGQALTAVRYWGYAALYGSGDNYDEPFFIPQIGALWFLLAAFWGGIFLRLSLNFKKYIRIAFVGALFLFGYLTRSICWFPLSIQAGACATLFMYMGYLLKSLIPILKNTSREIKCFGICVAVIATAYFIKDFQSFWLVHCDIGRGIVDIFGCICACTLVICISRLIDDKLKYISEFFAYFGKYSLLVLCIHNIELSLFPWWSLADKLVQCGMASGLRLYFIIFAKLVVDLTCAYILSKIPIVRKVYGLK